MINLKNKKIVVTGASSMIGRSTTKILKERGAIVIPLFHEDYDLVEYAQALKAFKKHKPDYCIHLAGYSGNVQFNKDYPSDIFYNTVAMGLNTLKAASECGVEKIVSALASCSYRSVDCELKEEDFWIGLPDRTSEGHGLGKKTIHAFSRQISRQYNTTAVCTIFNTAYGPYDSFDVNKTKVIGGLIKKFVDAEKNNLPEVECWGTGRPRREFIYCDDAAEGVVQALEKYDFVDLPLNIGFNEDISIKELAEIIKVATNYQGRLFWNTEKPDGQFRKILDSSRMKEFGVSIENRINLLEGLEKTIGWYQENEM